VVRQEEPRAVLPVPRIVAVEGGLRLSDDYPHSIGRVRTFHGNFGMLVRAYTYMRPWAAMDRAHDRTRGG
jgi:glycine dehydrogenase subunit 2